MQISASKLIGHLRRHPVAILAVGAFTYLSGHLALARGFLPYDEQYHYGLVQYYAHHANPFMGHEPAGMGAYGVVAHQGSYLYHYLMSLPLRLIQPFVHSQYAQLLVLRSLNILLGIATLYLLYRLARRLGLGAVAAQVVVLAFALTPVFYQLSAQLNYDNLLIPITILCIVMALKITEQIRTGGDWAFQTAGLVSLLLVASLVKYSFLPIMAAIVLYLAVLLFRSYGWRGIAKALANGFRGVSRWQKVAIVTLLVASGLLWGQRYGVNLVQYHTPNPQCNAVMSVQTCSAYGTWSRNYQLHATRDERPMSGLQLTYFTHIWAKMMAAEPYSIVQVSPDGHPTYVKQQPLLSVAMVIVGAGCLALLLSFRRLMRLPALPLLASVTAAYLLVLWGQNFADYHNLHFLVAVQGRYLLPVLPILYAGLALAYVYAFDTVLNFQRTRLRAALGGLVVVCWLGLQSLRRIGHLVLESITRTGARAQVFAHDLVVRDPSI